jgi:hypothetical protein
MNEENKKGPDSKKEPAKELSKEQKDFFDTFFRRGQEFTSELIAELESLRKKHDLLSRENVELRHQLASDDAIRDLLKKIDHLEHEKKKLQNNASDAEAETEDYVGRYAEIEKELDAMASLYVALYQLHATLSPTEVLGVIEQLLAQFIGAGSFVIYLRRQAGQALVLDPVHAYHCNDAAGVQIEWNEGPVGEAAATQLHSVANLEQRKPGTPLACIPMVLEDETIGVIAIMKFFEQKTEFVEIDFEFFKLLAIHSASAIVGSGLMAQAGGIEPSLESYERL